MVAMTGDLSVDFLRSIKTLSVERLMKIDYAYVN
jgi:hypothetical protein